MNCAQAAEWMNRRLDGELDAAQGEALARHLAACPDCRALSRGMERLEGALAELARESDAMLALDLEARMTRKPLRTASAWGVLGGLAAAACVGLMTLVSSAVFKGRGEIRKAPLPDRAFSVRLIGESERELLAARVDSGVPGVHLVLLAPVAGPTEAAGSRPARRK